MALRRIITGAAGAAIMVAVLAIDAAPASAACRPSKEAFARGPFQTVTEISARNKWRSAVRASYGVRFSRWSLAQEKTMRCRKILPGRRWHCVARARPCNS
jgi:hypothetical protein